MIERWTWPAYVAVLGGALVFAALFVPIVVVQSRRYGRLSFRRLLGAAAVAVYGVALVAYTLLPLPTGDAALWCAENAVSGARTTPLQFLDDIRRDTAGIGWRARLLHPTVLQVVLNVVLFVPWGLLWRRFLGRGVITATLSGLAVSGLIELTQYTGIFGIVPCAYRVGDVDDLIANASGAFLGALLAPLLLAWMPQTRDLAPTRREPRPVTVWRRWLGMGIDAILSLALGAVLVIGARLALLAVGREIDDLPLTWEWALGNVVPWVFVFVLPVLWGTRASFGQRAMWLAPVRVDDEGVARRLGLVRGLVRAGVTGGLWGLLSAVGALPVGGGGESGLDAGTWADVAQACGAAAAVVAFVAVIAVPPTREHRGLSGVVSGTEMRDQRAPLDA